MTFSNHTLSVIAASRCQEAAGESALSFVIFEKAGRRTCPILLAPEADDKLSFEALPPCLIDPDCVCVQGQPPIEEGEHKG